VEGEARVQSFDGPEKDIKGRKRGIGRGKRNELDSFHYWQRRGKGRKYLVRADVVGLGFNRTVPLGYQPLITLGRKTIGGEEKGLKEGGLARNQKRQFLINLSCQEKQPKGRKK